MPPYLDLLLPTGAVLSLVTAGYYLVYRPVAAEGEQMVATQRAFAATVSEDPGLPQVVGGFLEHLKQVLAPRHVSVYLRDRRQRDQMYLAATTHEEVSSASQLVSLHHPVLTGAIKSGRLVITDEFEIGKGLVMKPLVCEGEVVGCVLVGPRRRTLSAKQAEYLEHMANQLAFYVKYEELKRVAYVDPLTRGHNRRYLMEQTAVLIAAGRPLGMIRLMLDQFRALEDAHGQDLAELVLSRVARVLQDLALVDDIAARWEGEEFAIALPDADRDGLALQAEKVRSALETLEIVDQRKAGRMVQVTASLGAALRAPGEELEDLLGRAELALAVARAAGGNQLSMAPQPSSERLIS